MADNCCNLWKVCIETSLGQCPLGTEYEGCVFGVKQKYCRPYLSGPVTGYVTIRHNIVIHPKAQGMKYGT